MKKPPLTGRSRRHLLGRLVAGIVVGLTSTSLVAQQPFRLPPSPAANGPNPGSAAALSGQTPTAPATFQTEPERRLPNDTSSAASHEKPVLRIIPVPPIHVPTVGTAIGLRYRNAPGVKISPDRREGRLLVMAPEAMQPKIAADVARLLPPDAGGVQHAVGQGQPRGQATQTSFGPGRLQLSLNQVGWQRFEDHLTMAAGRAIPVTTQRNGEIATFQLVDQPLEGTTIEVDRRANSVTVFAPQPAIAGWQKLIGSLDQSGMPAGSVTELVRVRNAEPAPVQQAIRLLGNLGASDEVGITRVANTPFAVAVQQEGAAPQGNDAPQGNGDAGTPDDGPAAPEEGVGLIGDVKVQFVPDLGVIVVKGSKRDVARVMDVIKQIEEKSAITKPDVVVHSLQHVNSQAIATLLEELYTEVLSARQGDVSITSLDKPNALLLIGRSEAVAAAIEVVNKLDQPVPAATQLRVFRLEHASAIDAEETVTNFFVDQPGDDEQRPGLGARARVVADYRTNSLIVQAAPRDLQEVAKLIQDLDVQNIPSKSELRIIKLKNALAEDLAEVIQGTIDGTEEGNTENGTVPSTSLSMVSVDADGNQLLNSGILAGIVVTADTNANALVVRGSSSALPLIEEMIRQLDQTPGTESLVKVFTLENGDSQQLTLALQELFGSGTSTGGVGALNVLGLAAATANIDSSLVSLRFSSDIRTNSIIASGSANDLEVVESILLRLDTSGFADRMFEVIWLRNQYAPDVATALQSFITSRQQQLQNIQQAQQGGLSPFDALERDVVVVAEPVSNSLVISVAPRLYTTIRRMIDQLDRRAPMVLVKVLIAEVTLADGFEFGTELGLQDSLQFDRGIASSNLPAGTNAPPSDTGFDFNNNNSANNNSLNAGALAERAVTSFATGTTSSAYNYGGFVLSAASDSISLLMRALQDAGRLQILSRPQLMTLDNTPGVVQVGSLVPRVTDVTSSANTGTTFGTEDLQVGLILRVTPRVGRDGLIVMNVDAIRSAVDEVAPGIPIGFSPTGEVITSPQIQQTQAQSVVTAYSGQTVIYGGLIQKTRSQTSRRVPYISNIPLIGALFRFDRETEKRSELLVVLTPMIVSSEEDLEYVKQTESARMSWCLPEVIEMNGDVGLSGGHGLWGPALAPVIYPDLQPTIDDIHIQSDVPTDVYYPEEGVSPQPSVLMESAGPVKEAPSTQNPQPNDVKPVQYMNQGTPSAAGSTSAAAAGFPAPIQGIPQSPPSAQRGYSTAGGYSPASGYPTSSGTAPQRIPQPAQ